MTRKDDDKKSISVDESSLSEYDEKIEARFTKVARAKTQQGNDSKRPPHLGTSHEHDGGDHQF